VVRGKKLTGAAGARVSPIDAPTLTLPPKRCYNTRQRAAMTHALGIRRIDPSGGVWGWIP